MTPGVLRLPSNVYFHSPHKDARRLARRVPDRDGDLHAVRGSAWSAAARASLAGDQRGVGHVDGQPRDARLERSDRARGSPASAALLLLKEHQVVAVGIAERELAIPGGPDLRRAFGLHALRHDGL